MNKVKHTQGPWAINIVNPYNIQIRAKLPRNNEFEYSVAILSGWDAQEKGANARLIAAAPDLLEALRGISERCGPYNDNGGWPDELPHERQILNTIGETARAAIAKAEGK